MMKTMYSCKSCDYITNDLAALTQHEAAHFISKPTANLLSDRATTHGNFEDNAQYAQHLRTFFRDSTDWQLMPARHREALDMIACKLARILSGQSSFPDHWDDIAGYAKLAIQPGDPK